VAAPLRGEEEEKEEEEEEQPAREVAPQRRLFRLSRGALASSALGVALLLFGWAGGVTFTSSLRGSSQTAHSLLEDLESGDSVLALVSKNSSNCTGPGENCLPHKCCDTQGFECYQKSKDYASCRPKDSCKPGVDPEDPPKFQTPWTCKVLGGPGPHAKKPPPTAPPAPPAAPANSGCYLVDHGKLLMVKHSYGTFDIPGGLAEAGEIPEKTACRETWEETGYKVTATGLKTVTSNGFHIFNCKLLEPKPAGSPDPAEVSAVMWNPLNALPQTGWRFQEELALFR